MEQPRSSLTDGELSKIAYLKEVIVDPDGCEVGG